MRVTITSIELKSVFKFFPLSLYALNILKQLRSSTCIDIRKRGVLTMHYTMTLWLNETALKKFARSGAHLEAMKKGNRIAKEVKTYTFEAKKLPTWEEAKNILNENGKVVKYR